MAERKIALITGGSRGLGKNMALNLAAKGLDVILTYRTKKEEAEQTADGIREMGRRAATLQLDVSSTRQFAPFVSQVEEVLQSHFGVNKLDYLVNNAGIGLHQSFADTTEEELDLLYNIHFKSPYLLTQKLLPHLADGGGIVNISTGLARFSLPGYSAYAAMKGAIETLTQYQAKELGARKIRVNTVAPGAIETDFGGGIVRDNADVNAFVASTIALGRVGLPEDVGGVVAFLCTDDARWVNAQRLEVSGGQMI